MNVEFLRRLYRQEGETNMNSLKDNVAVVTDAMYVIVGASGNTGSIIANSLLLKGEKVRVMGRDAERSRPNLAMRLRSPKPSAVRARRT